MNSFWIKKLLVIFYSDFIRYLDAWQLHHEGKENDWKFEKCRQIWLLTNAYDETKIPDSKVNL